MILNDRDKKHIIAMLTTNCQTLRMKLARDKKLLRDIENNTCTERQWQELYFRFLREE